MPLDPLDPDHNDITIEMVRSKHQHFNNSHYLLVVMEEEAIIPVLLERFRDQGRLIVAHTPDLVMKYRAIETFRIVPGSWAQVVINNIDKLEAEGGKLKDPQLEDEKYLRGEHGAVFESEFDAGYSYLNNLERNVEKGFILVRGGKRSEA